MTDPEFDHITSAQEGDVLVLTFKLAQLRGDETVDILQQELMTALVESHCHKVVLDFRHVEYISSAGIRPLLALRRQLLKQGGRLALAGMRDVVSDVLVTTRLISTSGSAPVPFESAPNVKAALAMFEEPFLKD